jgi:MFS family permease
VAPWAALAHPQFRLLFFGLVVSMLGNQFTRVASAWVVWELTGSAAALGLAGLVAALPLVPVSLLGGALADAVERRRLMLATQLLALLTAASLALLAAAGRIEVWHLYLAGLLITVSGALDRPARQALIPSLVPREHLLNAYALMTTSMQAAGLIGPALAGLLLAFAGAAAAFAVDTVSFLAVVVALLLLRVPPIAGGGRAVSLSSIGEGLRFVLGRPIIVGLLGLDVAAMLFGYYPPLLPVIADSVLRAGEVGFGLLAAAPAVGSLAGGGLMLVIGQLRRPGWVMLGAVAGYGLALVGLGLSVWLPLSLLCAGLLGLTDAISVAIRQTAVQVHTPDEFRGRVSSLAQITFQGGNAIGAVNSGFAAAAFGIGPAAVLGGVLVGLVVALFGWLVRPLRTFRA